MAKLTVVVSVLFSLIVINNAFKIEPKIVRGYNAQSGQFPFFGFLEIVTSERVSFFYERENGAGCGATLISDQWAVTAAHCLLNAKRLTIHFGKTVLNAPQDTHVPIDVGRKNFFIYPRYDHEEALNDIALIRLPKKVTFTDYLQPLSLPTECKSPENVQAFAVGNGATSDRSSVSPQLKYALLETLPARICRQVYPHVRRSIVCAANMRDGQSVCRGDSGGPLVSREDGNLIGLSSFVRGDYGCEQGVPQGFTSVYPYLGWISSVTGLDLPKCN